MKITEKLHTLKHKFVIPVSPELKLERFVYSFIIFGKKKVYLIDSGVSDSESSILSYVEENGYSINDISLLILTHSHPDHIGSAGSIKEKTGCKVFAHDAEKEWIENIDKQFSDRPVPGFKNFVNRSVKVDRLMNDNEKINLEEGISIKVIHTPGHSKGSVSLLLENNEVLICADSLLLPGDLPIYENVVDAINSVKKLKKVKNLKWLLSSWGEPAASEQITAKFDQSIEYFKIIHKRIVEIDNAKELAPMDLCKKVIESMKLPPAAVNPLAAKGFQSNVKNLDNAVMN